MLNLVSHYLNRISAQLAASFPISLRVTSKNLGRLPGPSCISCRSTMGCGGSKEPAPLPDANIPKAVMQTGDNEREVSKRGKSPAKVPGLALTEAGIESGSGLEVVDEADEQMALLRETLKASRASLGDTHQSTLTSLNNLASMLHDRGDLEEAATLFREALAARRSTIGDKDPATLTSINNLGLLLQDRKEWDEAEALLREALESRKETLGAGHPETLDSLYNLGSLLQERGKTEDAIAFLREELQLATEHKGKGNSETVGERESAARPLAPELAPQLPDRSLPDRCLPDVRTERRRPVLLASRLSPLRVR